jgi:dynein heavy chain
MTFILKGIDELQQLLDDHVAITQQLTFSAFKKPFSDKIDQ